MLAVGAACCWHAALAQVPPASPVPNATQVGPQRGSAAGARLVLETHCSGCHQDGKISSNGSTLRNVLDFDAVLSDPSLAQPARPDASPLYTIMLTGHGRVVRTPGFPDPKLTPEEIDLVRGWLDQAGKPSATCPAKSLVGLPALGDMLRRLQAPGGDALKSIRFLSLAPQINACASDTVLKRGRDALKGLMQLLRTTESQVDLPLAADDLPVVAVRLTDLGWSSDDWDRLAMAAKGPQLFDKDLIATYGTQTPLLDASAFAAATEGSDRHFFSALFHHDPALLDLVRQGRAAVGKTEAAANLGIAVSTLEDILSRVKGRLEGAARALVQGEIDQESWRQLRGELAVPGDVAVLRYVSDGASQQTRPLGVRLWSSQIAYKTNDLVVLYTEVDQDCNLTVVNIDPHGEATVLFPSDSSPNNSVKAGTRLQIPAAAEPFQLRVTETGTETFVAVCDAKQKRLTGIDQDFEKQRFSALGNWRQFLKTAHTRETVIARNETPSRRRRRRPTQSQAELPADVGPALQVRAAIYVSIE